jgi:hypothetical protein
MHPVNYLFDEIYRDYWGIPPTLRDGLSKRRAELPLHRRRPLFRMRDRRG